MNEYIIVNRELTDEDHVYIQNMLEKLPLTKTYTFQAYHEQLISWMWSDCQIWPKYYLNISRIGDILDTIQINNFELGDHIFQIREDKYKLEQYEKLDYPLAPSIYSGHSITYIPKEIETINISYREIYNIFKPVVNQEFEKSLENKYGKFYKWKDKLVYEFKNNCLNFYCIGTPENYKFLEYNYNNPPIFPKPLLIPDENQNRYDWEEDNKEQLLKEINFYDNFTNLEKNKPVHSTMQDIVLSVDENDIGLILQIQPACGPNCPLCIRMMLHYETVIVIKDEHIKNRKKINSNVVAYMEILKSWQIFCDKNIKDSVEEYLNNHIPSQEYFRIPSSENILPAYNVKFKYYYDSNERIEFIKSWNKQKWRDTSIL